MYSLKNSKPEQEPIEVDIHFQETLTPDNVAHVAIELIKNLMFQRHQIPMTFESVKKEVERFKVDSKAYSAGTGTSTPDGERKLSLTEINRQKTKRRMALKLRARLAKRAEKFLECFDEFEAGARKILLDPELQVLTMSVIMGPSAISPKEIYFVKLPKDYNVQSNSKDQTSAKGMNRRATMIQLFRAVMAHDELNTRISSDLSLTSTYLSFEVREVKNANIAGSVDNKTVIKALSEKLRKTVPEVALKPELEKDWNAKRIKLTTFKLSHTAPTSSHQQRQFVREKRLAKISGNDRYTPAKMEMCTPFVPRNHFEGRARTASGSSFTNEIMPETPCQKYPVPLEQIQENLANLDILEEDGLENSENVDPKTKQDRGTVWFCANRHLKGFRDPQVESS